MNAISSISDIDPLRDSAWIGAAAFALLFGISFLVAVIGGGKVNQSLLQLVLAQVIFVPRGCG